MNFESFFTSARNTTELPFDYQIRLACGERQTEESQTQWCSHGTYCSSRVISVPTGLGKTAAVLLAWLFNRVAQQRSDWPRRLVYCLPMRTLVEQTEKSAQDWLNNLRHAGCLPQNVDVHVLMGGAHADSWDIYPDAPAVLVGTQDMLLSRALNRGYGMSRYRWPVHFAALNTDCLWVLDETQLMGVGVETSAQLDAFRRLLNGDRTFTWWMSATLNVDQLETVDHPKPAGGWPALNLNETDLTLPTVQARFTANKPLTQTPVGLDTTSRKEYPKALADFIRAKHRPGTLTLAVFNRVSRAQQVYENLRQAGMPADELTLIHSRFRPGDRRKNQELLGRDGNRIVVATQAVEAGVDVSACTLVTELAPWSSLVQRFGRYNRRGEYATQAQVFWTDIRWKDDADELALPYRTSDLAVARQHLAALANVSPQSLDRISVSEARQIHPVLRRKDLVDLFDTTPDLCGNDLDISRYIRDHEDSDVQIFWRNVEKAEPTSKLAPPSREELCRVGVRQFQQFLGQKSRPSAYTWDPCREEWQRVSRVRPGGVYLLNQEAGGYSTELGWTGDPRDKPTTLTETLSQNEGDGRNEETFIGKWISLEDHIAHVVSHVASIGRALSLDSDLMDALQTAAVWHDVGKAHPVFQEMLLRGSPTAKPDTIWAKSENLSNRPSRKEFRHELASALAWLASGCEDHKWRDLIAYLVAAHHGKVRLSIRSLPDEDPPVTGPDRLHARGVWDGDEMPAVALNGHHLEKTTLDLNVMNMGEGPQGPSWLSRMSDLRDGMGLFRLAFLESILRAADARASIEEAS